MRVTFVLPQATLAGGIRVCAIYAEYLRSRGHKVFVISTPETDFTPREKVKNWLLGRSTRRPALGPSHFDQVRVEHRVLDQYRPVTDKDVPDADVVVATWWETAEWVAELSPRKGKKVHLIQHDETQISFQPIERVEATWRLPLNRVAVAQWLVELGAERYGVPGVELIANGVDLKLFNAPPRDKQLVPTVGLMYSKANFKGLDIALEAYSHAVRNVGGLKLVAFGLEDEPIEELPLPMTAFYQSRPPQERLREIYAMCDAWLFASRSEGFGLPILEAMACRTPVIGTPAGAAPDLIGEGGGILVKPQDAIDMSKAIERVSRMNSAEWKQMSDAAFATAQQNTWDSSCLKFEAYLLELVNTREAA
jgi:glycosyltransferase involved in cell wall biosynthesis